MRSITYVLCRKKSSAWGPIRSQFGEHVGPHQHAQHNLQWWRTCTEGRRWLPSRGNGDWRRSAHESDQTTRTAPPDRWRLEPTVAEPAIRCCPSGCATRCGTFGPAPVPLVTGVAAERSRFDRKPGLPSVVGFQRQRRLATRPSDVVPPITGTRQLLSRSPFASGSPLFT